MTDLHRLRVPARHDASVDRRIDYRVDEGMRHVLIFLKDNGESSDAPDADYNQRPISIAMA
ncbi:MULTISPECIES: hypothetical protein [Pseudomonas]|uniref:hypothetical protein n=1 Tax=Pseudomonas TaxID=286 RepID=UPI0005BEADD8|nr:MULTISPECIES: hypothetical protein [Pseudomonas]AJO77152.1 hypothetical protein TO66_07505 [Pseudomonas sp. MRSN 12121]MCB2252765.1 hypothetical protein [Pseudomonas chlororaphis]